MSERANERRALHCLLRYRDPGQTPYRRITPAMKADLLGWATSLSDEDLLDMRGVGPTLLRRIRELQPTGYVPGMAYGTGGNDLSPVWAMGANDAWDALFDELGESPLPGARYALDVVKRRRARIDARLVEAERVVDAARLVAQWAHARASGPLVELNAELVELGDLVRRYRHEL